MHEYEKKAVFHFVKMAKNSRQNALSRNVSVKKANISRKIGIKNIVSKMFKVTSCCVKNYEKSICNTNHFFLRNFTFAAQPNAVVKIFQLLRCGNVNQIGEHVQRTTRQSLTCLIMKPAKDTGFFLCTFFINLVCLL